jgi:hypothetical protein
MRVAREEKAFCPSTLKQIGTSPPVTLVSDQASIPVDPLNQAIGLRSNLRAMRFHVEVRLAKLKLKLKLKLGQVVRYGLLPFHT